MKLITKIKSTDAMLKARGLEPYGRVQTFIDSETLRLCEPYVPMDTKALINSGPSVSRIGSGVVKYQTPYAVKVYYTKMGFQGAPKRGNYWFERMKSDGGKTKILKGARKLAGGV